MKQRCFGYPGTQDRFIHQSPNNLLSETRPHECKTLCSIRGCYLETPKMNLNSGTVKYSGIMAICAILYFVNWSLHSLESKKFCFLFFVFFPLNSDVTRSDVRFIILRDQQEASQKDCAFHNGIENILESQCLSFLAQSLCPWCLPYRFMQ